MEKKKIKSISMINKGTNEWTKKIYDERGNIIKEEYPDNIIESTFNDNNKVCTITQTKDNIKQIWEYDKKGREISYVYTSDVDKTLSIKTEYDDENKSKTATSGLECILTTKFDERGNGIEITRKDGINNFSIKRNYNDRNDLLSTIEENTNNPTRTEYEYVYDGDLKTVRMTEFKGDKINLISITKCKGDKQIYHSSIIENSVFESWTEYDEQGRFKRYHDNKGKETIKDYSDITNTVVFISKENGVIIYVRNTILDKMGRTHIETDSAGFYEINEYNDNGDLIYCENQDCTITYEYEYFE